MFTLMRYWKSFLTAKFFNLFSRYEIFMDVVKPDNLNIEFLREFMMLPTSYYVPGAALKFRESFLYD